MRDRPIVLSGSILIVEDDPALRESLELFLRAEGHRTAAASDGREAIELVARKVVRPDLVIVDYNLPNGLNGLQVMANLRDILGGDAPALVLTGDISTQTLREIAAQGYLQRSKPVGAEDLTSLISSLLSEHRSAETPHARPRSTGGNTVRAPVVFLVDDDGAVRDAIRHLLVANGRTVEAFASAEAFIDAYRPGVEGCLVVDAMMPGMGGFALLKLIKDEGYRLPAIMITGNGDVPTAVRAMRAGAADFIEKPVSGDELIASIDKALGWMKDWTEQSASRRQATARLAGLTARQREILELVLAGRPSKIIAADLGLSQRTVENHRAAIMHKTGSKSLSALVRLALAAT